MEKKTKRYIMIESGGSGGGGCGISTEEIRKIYEELDLNEKGITEEEIARRKTRIFVGGLKFASEDHVLHDYFANFGKIKEAVVIRDRKTGLSKGYGFVTMLEDIPALRAIFDKSPKLDGRRCNVNLAYIGQKNKPQARTVPTKPRDTRHVTPQMCGYPNGIMLSPTVFMAGDGHYYQLTTPPPPTYHPGPIFHVHQGAPAAAPYDQATPRAEMYPAPPPPPPPGVPVMYTNPIVVPAQPVMMATATDQQHHQQHQTPSTNPTNNNNNIYLTNNIYYRTPGPTPPSPRDGSAAAAAACATVNGKTQLCTGVTVSAGRGPPTHGLHFVPQRPLQPPMLTPPAIHFPFPAAIQPISFENGPPAAHGLADATGTKVISKCDSAAINVAIATKKVTCQTILTASEIRDEKASSADVA